MSIMAGAFLEGIGKGTAGIGAMAMKYQAELDELAAKREALLDRIKLEYASKAAELAAGREETAGRRSRLLSAYGVDADQRADTDPSFQEAGPTMDGEPLVNRDKIRQYRDQQSRGAVAAEIQSWKPEAWDDVTKGNRTDWITSRMQKANTPEGIWTESFAEQGKDRFKVDQDEKIDQLNKEGFEGQTDQGKAKIRLDDAKAAEARADAAKKNAEAGGDSGGKPATLREANQRLESARKRLNDAIAQVRSTFYGDGSFSTDKPEDRQRRIEEHSDVKAARAEFNKVQTWVNEFAAGTEPKAVKDARGKDEAALRAEANAAIAKGKSRAAVAARFRQLTGKEL